MRYRLFGLGGCLLLAATCLLAFTLIGSTLIERFGWLKPVAGIVLVFVGIKRAFDYFSGH